MIYIKSNFIVSAFRTRRPARTRQLRAWLKRMCRNHKVYVYNSPVRLRYRMAARVAARKRTDLSMKTHNQAETAA